MMDLQQAALDVRTREHYRKADDANRNGWLRADLRNAEPSMAPRPVLATLRHHLASSLQIERTYRPFGRRNVSVIGENMLGAA